MTSTPIAKSTFLDMVGYQLSSAPDVPTAFRFDRSTEDNASSSVVVALTLDRANDPTALLGEDWADRQSSIAQMTADGALWTTYGANPVIYNDTLASLHAMGIRTLGPADGYVSSAASRTIWVDLQPTQFQRLFGTPLQATTANEGLLYWNGSLSLPSSIAGNVSGLWFETGSGLPTPETDTTGSVKLKDGSQSIGNAGGESGLYPNEVATLYHAPLSSGSTLATPTVALIEPSVGDGYLNGGNFQSLLDIFRQHAKLTTPGSYYAVQPSFVTSAGALESGERSLDVGVVTTAAPNTTIGLYAGGDGGDAGDRGTFSTDMAAVWDMTNHPADISSSVSDDNPATPGSPFYAAYNALWQDAALRNISVFFSAGDGGSQEKYGSGQPMTDQSHSSPYAVIVGGSSLSTFKEAEKDGTLSAMLGAADRHDPATLRLLMAGGLTVMPVAGQNADSIFIETVWNQYKLKGNTIGFDQNETTAGGVDDTQAPPGYQADYGLNPMSTGTDPQPGRGVPDVASTSGGNLAALVPDAVMSTVTSTIDGNAFNGLGPDGGTSGAAPFWAALTAQFQAIFADQGLPSTGYFTDLLYQAAAVAPASFNDVQLGNNNSTYIRDPNGPYVLAKSGDTATITGTASGAYGYSAGPGYDLTTGLGTPNGLLLARSLTAIAQAQMFSQAPALIDDDGNFVAAGTLLVQPDLITDGIVSVDGRGIAATVSDTYAWSNQLAGQALQTTYDPNLITMFDRAAEGTASEISVSAGQPLSVAVDGSEASVYQATDTSPFGFVQTRDTAGDEVTLARPLAVAQTAKGADDQDAIVRIRQNGWSDSSLTFYRVDDFSGDIGGIAPGQAGYAAAAFARAYRTTDGSAIITDPGYGQQMQTALTGVNAGDLIAAELTDGANQFWGFAGENERLNGSAITHLWNYGMNTFGFEDMPGGGDRDYNDAVFQLDFTSAAGHGLLA